MGNKLMIVKIVFEYFVEYFKKGKDEPYHSYTENYPITKAFDQRKYYPEIIEECRKELESEFTFESTDKDDEGKEFKCRISYDIPRLISYQILAEED